MSNDHKPDHHACCGGHNHEPSKQSRVLDASVEASGQTTLRVAGMDCADEVEAIQRVLQSLSGVREIHVNLMGGKVTITHDASIKPQALVAAIASTGLKASVPEVAGETSGAGQHTRLISVVVSGIFTGIGLLLEWTKFLGPWGRVIGFAAAIVAGGWFILPKATRALRRFALDMNVLMTAAVLGASAIGEWSEAAAVAFLFALSELLEAFSLN